MNQKMKGFYYEKHASDYLGGAAPYKYQWYHGTSPSSYSAISSTAMTISFKPAPSPATQYLKCAVIDSNGSVAETPPLVITLKDTTLKAKLDKTNISAAVNEVFTINCSVTGGTSPYTYKWFFGDKSGNFTDMTTYYTPVSAVIFSIHSLTFVSCYGKIKAALKQNTQKNERNIP